MRLWLVWERDFPQTQTRDFMEADFHSAFYSPQHMHMSTFHVRMMMRRHAVDYYYYYFGMFDSDKYLSGSGI